MKIYIFPVWCIMKMVHFFSDRDHWSYHPNDMELAKKYSEWLAHQLKFSEKPIKSMALTLWLAFYCVLMLVLIISNK